MQVLVVGSGGREHALAWKLSQSKHVRKVYIAPGNAGTSLCGENVVIPAEDIDGLKTFALAKRIDLTVVGPELSLTLGIVDAFEAAGLKIFGPSKAASELEGSKAFSKDLMRRYNIPTAFYKKFDDYDQACDYIETHKPPYVVKADGLAAGKGVYICATAREAYSALDAMMRKKAFGSAGSKVVIEEFLTGEEASFLAITDGKTIVPLPAAQDHKAVFDNDAGPNTGGMGAYSPAPVITETLAKDILDTVIHPAINALGAEGRPYAGVIYAGLMISGGKPKVLEFNCRFGDPETQPILMRLESDLFELLLAASERRLRDVTPVWSPRASVCVVMASGGYPGDYSKGSVISGLDEAAKIKDVMVFHAGTAAKGGKVVTNGGRVLGVTALGDTIKDAIGRAYEAAGVISWEGAHYRKDIGRKALSRG